MDNAIRQRLMEYAERYESPEFIDGDPSWFMHQVDGDRNREATAFVASALSYGSRAQFMPKTALLLEWAEGDIDRWVRSGAYAERLAEGDNDCFYRLYNRGAMNVFLSAYSRLMAEYGSLGEYVNKTQRTPDGLSAVRAITGWFAQWSGQPVIPHDASSACKRVCMFLRWMVRSGSPVDLGLWARFIDRRQLIMPLDTHVLQQSCSLGLLNSRTATMSAALRLTSAMAEVFPDDPLRGDFALFGVGVDKTVN